TEKKIEFKNTKPETVKKVIQFLHTGTFPELTSVNSKKITEEDIDLFKFLELLLLRDISELLQTNLFFNDILVNPLDIMHKYEKYFQILSRIKTLCFAYFAGIYNKIGNLNICYDIISSDEKNICCKHSNVQHSLIDNVMDNCDCESKDKSTEKKKREKQEKIKQIALCCQCSNMLSISTKQKKDNKELIEKCKKTIQFRQTMNKYMETNLSDTENKKSGETKSDFDLMQEYIFSYEDKKDEMMEKIMMREEKTKEKSWLDLPEEIEEITGSKKFKKKLIYKVIFNHIIKYNLHDFLGEAQTESKNSTSEKIDDSQPMKESKTNKTERKEKKNKYQTYSKTHDSQSIKESEKHKIVKKKNKEEKSDKQKKEPKKTDINDVD
ncbi:MAG TPA: hypothetical protein VN704_05570, partial [Verrucomicrobiae bacterium]|nr:hypothetical protein [Verrucomicrobiae bacterium]